MTKITHFLDEHFFLSNFYDHEFTVVINGHSYTGLTVEHVFQACKTNNMHDAKMILDAGTPFEAKRIGRRVKLRHDWEDIKLGIMSLCIEEKFTNPGLQKKLLNTKNARLVEGNYWHDNFWGVCTCDEHEEKGLNWLGRLLEIERSRLLL